MQRGSDASPSCHWGPTLRNAIRLSPLERSELLQAPTLTLEETAQVLGVGLSALRDAIRRDDIPLRAIAIGSRKVIPTASVLRMLGTGEVSIDDAPIGSCGPSGPHEA
jgi:hypothetical protein